MKLSTVDGRTSLQMESPATRDKKDITTAPDEPVATPAATPAAEPVAEGEDKKTEDKKDEKKEEKKEEKKDDAKSVVDMKSYSPFGEK
ncbi:unknown [Acetobacter sp. CAG:977]|nr:unknown [Acetobacter sp. CAG:977]